MTTGLGCVTLACRQRLTAHYGPPVTTWLERVPRLLEAAADAWQLRLTGYHDAGHASALALARTESDETVMLKAWFDQDRCRREIAALRHWVPENGHVLREQDAANSIACLRLVGAAPGGHTRPADGDRRVAEALARLQALPPPDGNFPSLDSYLHDIVERRVRRRLGRFGADVPAWCIRSGLDTQLASTRSEAVLLHADLYQENVPFTRTGHPVLLDPLPMVGDPAFDWAFFVVYHDLARDPIDRLHLASRASGIGVRALLPWCLRLCLDGLLYYREFNDRRRPRMEAVMVALAAEGTSQSAAGSRKGSCQFTGCGELAATI